MRSGEQVAKDMIAVHIGPDMRMEVVGAPSYFAKRSPPMGRDRSPGWVVGARRTVVGSSCGWQFSFVEKVKSELGIKALHRELEQVDGTYTLRESGEAYRGQIDSKNEALTPENTRFMERITELAGT